MKSAIADDFADAPVEIEHRCKREVDADPDKFGTEQPASRTRQRAGPPGIGVECPAKLSQWRQRRQSVAKPLYATPFLIDSDQQLG